MEPTKEVPTKGALAMMRLAADQRAALGETRRAARPWWHAAPAVAQRCAALAVAPVRAFNLVVETAVAACVLGVAVVGYMVWSGDIPQDRVVAFLKPIGKRVVDAVQSAAPANGVASVSDPDQQRTLP